MEESSGQSPVALGEGAVSVGGLQPGGLVLAPCSRKHDSAKDPGPLPPPYATAVAASPLHHLWSDLLQGRGWTKEVGEEHGTAVCPLHTQVFST